MVPFFFGWVVFLCFFFIIVWMKKSLFFMPVGIVAVYTLCWVCSVLRPRDTLLCAFSVCIVWTFVWGMHLGVVCHAADEPSSSLTVLGHSTNWHELKLLCLEVISTADDHLTKSGMVYDFYWTWSSEHAIWEAQMREQLSGLAFCAYMLDAVECDLSLHEIAEHEALCKKLVAISGTYDSRIELSRTRFLRWTIGLFISWLHNK
jgi:hypothetical protein